MDSQIQKMHLQENLKNEEHSLQMLQKKHQNQVKSSFLNYEYLMNQTYAHLFDVKNIQESQKQRNKYYVFAAQRKKQLFKIATKSNQQFLNNIISYCQDQDGKINQQISKYPVSHDNFSKIKVTLKQFYRQWAQQSEQKNDYLKIVQKAKKYLQKGSKVLAPGSGLGRLVLQFVQAGFGCQGNQVTYFMLYASNFILNCAEQKRAYKIYPFIHSMDYHYDDEDIFRSILIPDKVACECVPQNSDFSMASGQFTQVYNKCPQQFDCVASCFFIDTANNVFDYIDTIHRTLKPNGFWINFGPLLFHYRQIYKEISIQVSWEILKKYIQKKFYFIQQEQMIKTTYCHDPKGDLTVRYNCLMFVCKKK